MAVNAAQRSSQQRPCPICRGHPGLPQGKGTRCYGFVSDEGEWAHCTREEYANGLAANSGSGAYPHKLRGSCGCGARHGPDSGPQVHDEKIWEIRDPSSGAVVAFHHRRNLHNGKKKLWWSRPNHPDGLGGLKSVDLPLYRAHLLYSRPGGSVIVTEGESACDALDKIGVQAVGTVTGAKATPRKRTLDVLRGWEVYLWPDNDPDGAGHMDRISRELSACGVPVRIINWTGAPPKGDAADFLALGGTRQDLEGLLGQAIPWHRPSTNGGQPEGIGRSVQGSFGDERGVHHTDVGNAKRLVHRHGQDLRYCWPFKQWLVWDGIRWKPDASGRLTALAKSVVLELYTEARDLFNEATDAEKQNEKERADRLKANADSLGKHARLSEAAPRIAATIDLARSEDGIPVWPDQLDVDPMVLNVKNGTIDLITGELRQHRREDLLTKLAPVNYDRGASLDLWTRFLEEVLPDADTRKYVQRAAGNTILGRADDDLLMVCHGLGGTGKGTFLGAIQAVMGDYAAAAELETFTTKRDAHGPQPDMARLRGRRMVAISEVDTGGTLALLKRATGGDLIVTRSHNQESFEFSPQFTIWIICNDRPHIPDTDSGMRRRVREIPFTTKFDKPDPTIRSKLRDLQVAGPVVLAWLVQGRLDCQKEGLGNLPKAVEAATADYKLEMNPLTDFLEDCCVAHADIWGAGPKLFKAYHDWAKENGLRHPVGKKGFGQRMGDIFKEKRRIFAGKTTRGFEGVGLACDHPEIASEDSKNSPGEGPSSQEDDTS